MNQVKEKINQFSSEINSYEGFIHFREVRPWVAAFAEAWKLIENDYPRSRIRYIEDILMGKTEPQSNGDEA